MGAAERWYEMCVEVVWSGALQAIERWYECCREEVWWQLESWSGGCEKVLWRLLDVVWRLLWAGISRLSRWR